jgi:hypothetical protein
VLPVAAHRWVLTDNRNGSVAHVLGVGTVELKISSGKIVHLKNVQHAPSINRNLISGSLLCRDSYKLVFESNKVIISKFGNFVGKGYESGGLFHLNTIELNFHLNIASMNKIGESNPVSVISILTRF